MRVLSPPEAEVALRNGVVAVLVVPGAVPRPARPRRPRIATIANRPESHLARLTVDAALQRAAGRQDVWKANDQQVVTPGSRYIDWLMPGLLGMNIMGTGLWSIGFSVVMARTRKLLKRLMATPMPRGYYLLSHLLARLGFLVLEVVVLLFFGWLVFGVTSQGSLLLLSGLCLLGAFSFAGLGLLIASRAKTIEAVSGLMNVAMLPMWLLSGVFFSSANFPEVAQPFIQIAAADRADRRAARRDDRRPVVRRHRARDRHPVGVGRRHLPARAEAVPLALTPRRGVGSLAEADANPDTMMLHGVTQIRTGIRVW